jgi:hypothetical protein
MGEILSIGLQVYAGRRIFMTEVVGPDRDFAGYGRRGLRIAWPGRARVAVCLIVNYETGADTAGGHEQRLLAAQQIDHRLGVFAA